MKRNRKEKTPNAENGSFSFYLLKNRAVTGLFFGGYFDGRMEKKEYAEKEEETAAETSVFSGFAKKGFGKTADFIQTRLTKSVKWIILLKVKQTESVIFPIRSVGEALLAIKFYYPLIKFFNF